MHFSKQIALSLAIAFTTASPAVGSMKARGVSPEDVVQPEEPFLSIYQQCVRELHAFSGYTYNVVINDAIDFTDDDCGSGFLDNINGRGCSVTNWGCNYADDERTMNANFNSDIGCGDDDISAAINAAFGGLEVECEDYDSIESPY